MLGPIFVRELQTLPRRPRHYVTRTAYLGLLWVLALTAWQALVGWEQTATLGDNARFGLLVFQVLTYVQLTLLLFFSSLSAASSITLEKERRTFVLLLMTDLRNSEIVLGKLGGSLLQILLLLLGTVPVLALLTLLGGVAADQLVQAIVIHAATAVVAGSLGILIALWRDKTFQSLALTVLVIVLYLCLVQALGVIPHLTYWFTGTTQVAPSTIEAWQDSLQPFLALQSVIGATHETEANFPAAYRFGVAMLVLTSVLNGIGVWRLRIWNPSNEPIVHRGVLTDEEQEHAEARADTPEERARRIQAHAAPGEARPVWANPILWREIATRAYGRRPLIVKIAYFLVLALVCWYALAPIEGGRSSAWAAAAGIVPVGILSLLLLSAQAVTAITSERDIGALDLLLVTDLTPQEFIFGKLGGILWNAKEFLIPPVALAIYYGLTNQLSSPPNLYRSIEASICLSIAVLVLMGFAMTLGLHVALRNEVSRLAVANALGTVFFLSVGTLLTIYLILITGQFETQWFSFVFFLGIGIGGLLWVLNADLPEPSNALTIAGFLCPLAVFYTVSTLLIGKPATRESADPLVPFLVTSFAFGFTIAGMLVPLLSEFDVALGRTSGRGE